MTDGELRLTVVGGGLRQLAEGLPRSDRELVGALTLQSRAVALHHRRRR